MLMYNMYVCVLDRWIFSIILGTYWRGSNRFSFFNIVITMSYVFSFCLFTNYFTFEHLICNVRDVTHNIVPFVSITNFGCVFIYRISTKKYRIWGIWARLWLYTIITPLTPVSSNGKKKRNKKEGEHFIAHLSSSI